MGRPRVPLVDRLWPEYVDERDDNAFSPNLEPGAGWLRSIADEANEKREWKRSWSHILKRLPSFDASAVRRCGQDLVRFHNPKTGLDVIYAKRCHNYYCPHCPQAAHYFRTLYHARKIASLDPTDERPEPKVVNLVFTLPPTLHEWTRTDPRVLPAWRRAILRTIAGAFGYKGKQGYPMERVAFKELGAILNLHAIGDEAQPWPKWAPHYDIIMPAWKRAGDKIEPLRTTWPERFAATNKRYRLQLQEQLLPIATKPNYRLGIVDFLKTDFDTVWHVSRPPRTHSNPDGKGMIHEESAMHRIRYSCRPLFSMIHALYRNDNNKEEILYEVTGKNLRPLVHRVPLGPALGQLESIRSWMTGRMARSQAGILSKTSYDAAAHLAGHEPVREKVKRGLVCKVTYETGPDGMYVMTRRGAASLDADGSDDDAL